MIKYKLTDQHHMTYNGTLWGEGVTHKASGRGELCGAGWIHVYESPELAVLLNPIHANFEKPVLWTCEVSGKEKLDRGIKSGYTQVTTLRKIPLPKISSFKKVKLAFAISSQVYVEPKHLRWIKRWLNSTEKSAEVAELEAKRLWDVSLKISEKRSALVREYFGYNSLPPNFSREEEKLYIETMKTSSAREATLAAYYYAKKDRKNAASFVAESLVKATRADSNLELASTVKSLLKNI